MSLVPVAHADIPPTKPVTHIVSSAVGGSWLGASQGQVKPVRLLVRTGGVQRVAPQSDKELALLNGLVLRHAPMSTGIAAVTTCRRDGWLVLGVFATVYNETFGDNIIEDPEFEKISRKVSFDYAWAKDSADELRCANVIWSKES